MSADPHRGRSATNASGDRRADDGTLSRRGVLLRGAGLALGAALARPSLVSAGTDEGTLLLGLWRQEMGAALAYASVLGVDPSLALIRAHETHHSIAVATQLAAVGLNTPPPPERPADLDIAGQRLAASGPERARVLAAAIALEENLVEIYKDALPVFTDENIAMTAATILGSHAQHLFMLRQSARVT